MTTLNGITVTQRKGITAPKQWHFVCSHCRNHLVLRHLIRLNEHEYNKKERYICTWCNSGRPVPLSAITEYRMVQLDYKRGAITMDGIEVKIHGVPHIGSPEVIAKLGGDHMRSALWSDKKRVNCPLHGKGIKYGNTVYFPESVVAEYYTWRATRPQRQSSHAPFPGAIKIKGWLSQAQIDLLNSEGFWYAEQIEELGEFNPQFEKAYQRRTKTEDATE